jgi:type 2 lantibiotic (TIGR03893 family)
MQEEFKMNNQKLNHLVGKSFEDLSVDEMQDLQGSGDVEVQSTPTVVVPISTIEISQAVSALLSVASMSVASYLASKAKKCDK